MNAETPEIAAEALGLVRQIAPICHFLTNDQLGFLRLMVDHNKLKPRHLGILKGFLAYAKKEERPNYSTTWVGTVDLLSGLRIYDFVEPWEIEAVNRVNILDERERQRELDNIKEWVEARGKGVEPKSTTVRLLPYGVPEKVVALIEQARKGQFERDMEFERILNGEGGE